jgi:hypothetical protein
MAREELISQAIKALNTWEESVRNLSNAVEELGNAFTEMKSAEEDEAHYRESRCIEDTPDTSSFSSGKNRLAFSPTVETRRRYVEARWNKTTAETALIQAKAVVVEAMAKLQSTAPEVDT